MYTGRLAPSPTGLLHLGHAATFFVAHDRARAVGGRLWLRVDDLDEQRSKEAYVVAAKEDLLWLGVSWEGEVRQRERLGRYREAMRRLLGAGFVYPCFCSRKDLLLATQAPHEEPDDEPVYHGRCRPKRDFSDANCALLSGFCMQKRDSCTTAFSSAPESAQTAGVVHEDALEPNTNYRFRVPDGAAVSFEDANCGPQAFIAGVDFGDFLVWRKDELPSYQLASAVDDADMGITEVVRGRDLLKSTARQILLQRALALPTPGYFHTELLRDARGQRLAKRHDALSLRVLRDAGVTPAEIRARVEAPLHPINM